MSILSLKPIKDILSTLKTGVLNVKQSEPISITQSAVEVTDIKFEMIDVADLVKTLSGVLIDGKTKALITVSDAPIRFRIDGEFPSAEIGHLVEQGQSITLSGSLTLFNFKAIRTTEENAVIQCTYIEEV